MLARLPDLNCERAAVGRWSGHGTGSTADGRRCVRGPSLGKTIERTGRVTLDADLGGGIVKQRVARSGQGRVAGYRMVIILRAGTRAVFLYAFPKNECRITDPDEAPSGAGSLHCPPSFVTRCGARRWTQCPGRGQRLHGEHLQTGSVVTPYGDKALYDCPAGTSTGTYASAMAASALPALRSFPGFAEPLREDQTVCSCPTVVADPTTELTGYQIAGPRKRSPVASNGDRAISQNPAAAAREEP